MATERQSGFYWVQDYKGRKWKPSHYFKPTQTWTILWTTKVFETKELYAIGSRIEPRDEDTRQGELQAAFVKGYKQGQMEILDKAKKRKLPQDKSCEGCTNKNVPYEEDCLVCTRNKERWDMYQPQGA